jgi:hypothetical protein
VPGKYLQAINIAGHHEKKLADELRSPVGGRSIYIDRCKIFCALIPGVANGFQTPPCAGFRPNPLCRFPALNFEG